MTNARKQIREFEGRYEVSNDGHIYSLIRGIRLVASPDTDGYLMVCLYRESGGRKNAVKVHQVVAEAFIGPRPYGLQVNHIDGNKQNNAAMNLEYVTAQGNTLHRYRVLGHSGIDPAQRKALAKQLWMDPAYRAKVLPKLLAIRPNTKGRKCTPEQVLNRRRAARISNMKRNYGEHWREEYARRYPQHAHEAAQ